MATREVVLMIGPGKPLKKTTVRTQHAGPSEIVIQVAAVVMQPLDAKVLMAGRGIASPL